MLLNTLESVRSKVLSDFHLQCLPQCPLIRQGTPRRHPMRWELGARETIEMTRNDSKWHHFHLTFCRWPGFISHDLLFAGCWNPCKPSGVGSFSEWNDSFWENHEIWLLWWIKERYCIVFWTASTSVLPQCLSTESSPQLWCKYGSTPGLALRKMACEPICHSREC